MMAGRRPLGAEWILDARVAPSLLGDALGIELPQPGKLVPGTAGVDADPIRLGVPDRRDVGPGAHRQVGRVFGQTLSPGIGHHVLVLERQPRGAIRPPAGGEKRAPLRRLLADDHHPHAHRDLRVGREVQVQGNQEMPRAFGEGQRLAVLPVGVGLGEETAVAATAAARPVRYRMAVTEGEGGRRSVMSGPRFAGLNVLIPSPWPGIRPGPGSASPRPSRRRPPPPPGSSPGCRRRCGCSSLPPRYR